MGCRATSAEAVPARGQLPESWEAAHLLRLSGLLGSNEEQTPFIHLKHSFLPGLGPEEGDVTKMQTDDGSLHSGWERAADLGQAGATLCVFVRWPSLVRDPMQTPPSHPD